MENDAAKVACLLSYAPVFFSSVRHRCLTSPTRQPLFGWGCAIFETMSDKQVVVLVGAFRRVRYRGDLWRDDQWSAPCRLRRICVSLKNC